MSENDDISSLLDELNAFSVPTPNIQKAVVNEEPLNEQDLKQYFLNKTKALVDMGLGAVQDLTPSVVASSDAKEIEALSKLMASTAQALDALQKTSLIDKKADRDEKLEQIRMENRKELALLQRGSQTINNNFLVASQEDIMKRLFNTNEKTITNN